MAGLRIAPYAAAVATSAALSSLSSSVSAAEVAVSSDTVAGNSAEAQSGQDFGGFDKCMKHIWPDVVDDCGGNLGYFGPCEVRVDHLYSKYSGSCSDYCSSFGFECAGARKVDWDADGCERPNSNPDMATGYMVCPDRTTDEQAICSCRDPYDTFLWKNADRKCGAGLALIQPAPERKTCAQYCKSQGLSCKAGLEGGDDEDPCEAGTSLGCSAPIADHGSICECGGEYFPAALHIDLTCCSRRVENVPAQKDEKCLDKVEVCEAATVHVTGKVLKEQGGTCADYCAGLRGRVPDFDLFYSCYGAWPADSVGCAALNREHRRSLRGLSASSWEACQKDFGGVDMLCACSYADRL